MRFLATESHSLRALRLRCCFVDEEEQSDIIKSCHESLEWVKTAQKIRTLEKLGISWRGIHGFLRSLPSIMKRFFRRFLARHPNILNLNYGVGIFALKHPCFPPIG